MRGAVRAASLLGLLGLLASLGSTFVARPAFADDKRTLPDYDGRGGEPTTAGDALLWVPRVVLSPVYFVSELMLRRPLGAVISAAERAGIPATLYDFFAFGPDHKAGIVPVAFLDFGFRPSGGLYGFWDDAFKSGNDLRAHFSTWGGDWIAGSLPIAFTIRRTHSTSFMWTLPAFTDPTMRTSV